MPLGKFKMGDILKKLDGYTGADIEAICREAALIAMRENKKTVSKKNFEEACKRVRATVTPNMMEYYNKMESMLVSGLSNIKRDERDFIGMEAM